MLQRYFDSMAVITAHDFLIEFISVYWTHVSRMCTFIVLQLVNVYGFASAFFQLDNRFVSEDLSIAHFFR